MCRSMGKTRSFWSETTTEASFLSNCQTHSSEDPSSPIQKLMLERLSRIWKLQNLTNSLTPKTRLSTELPDVLRDTKAIKTGLKGTFFVALQTHFNKYSAAKVLKRYPKSEEIGGILTEWKIKLVSSNFKSLFTKTRLKSKKTSILLCHYILKLHLLSLYRQFYAIFVDTPCICFEAYSFE